MAVVSVDIPPYHRSFCHVNCLKCFEICIVLLTDGKYVLQSSTAVEVGMKKGQDFCPQVGYPTASRNIQSFHVGKSKTQFELSFRNIPEVSHSVSNFRKPFGFSRFCFVALTI